ncbi:MAG TPA: hypothetical protein VLH86_02460 [Patescibacteria group bacterium]|nr:hypothetical protein [Patescibacteria group bacterium]
MSFFSSLFGSQQHSVADIKSTLDLVTYIAGLASNPDDIDPILDTVRAVTSDVRPGEAPTAADDEVLLGVYLQLEAYLTTREPIRTFTKDELRARMSPELRQQLAAYETNHKGGV